MAKENQTCVVVGCKAADCVYNQSLACIAPTIKISGAQSPPVCETYQRK